MRVPSLSNSTAAAWGKVVKRDAGNGQSHAQEIAVRDEKKREMMRDEMSRIRRVSRLVYFSSRQADIATSGRPAGVTIPLDQTLLSSRLPLPPPY